MNNKSGMTVDLRQMILALESAVDLVGINDTNHGKRVGFISTQIGHRLGFSEQAEQFVFELGMLHDCGVSTEQTHNNLVNQFNWGESQTHCDIGYGLLKDFSPLSKYALPILYHHTPWPKLKEAKIPPQVAKYANLTFLADRVDALAATHYETDILSARPTILDALSKYAEAYFDPALYEAFLPVASLEAFWIALGNRHITRFCWDMGNYQNKTVLTIAELKQMALIFSYVVDQKSPFTAQHSVRVGILARQIAEGFGLFGEQCDKVEIAGYLHDLGKLCIPDDILEKTGPLDDLQRGIMNRHSYETFEILRYIDGMGDIAHWAAYHHENLANTGYPFHPDAGELGVEARILAVADVFQALVQNRPYRSGMSAEKAGGILEEMAGKHYLDADLVGFIHQNLDKFYLIAKGSPSA